jgi:hypothetical protein
MATTLNMPPKSGQAQTSDDLGTTIGQTKPLLHRYRLQVDRQTKNSFNDKARAIAKGKAIKKAYPVVQVAIHDAETQERTIIATDAAS